MPRFEASRLIRHPLSEVFALVADGVQVGSIGTEPEGQLLRHEIEVEHVDGPRVGLGATYRKTNRVGPARPEEVVLMTAEYECDRRVAFRSDRGYDTVYELEAEDGATRLTCAREHDDQPKRLLGKLISRAALKEELVVPVIEEELLGIELALGSAERSAGPAEPDEDDPAGTPSSSTQGPPDDCRASTIIALPPSAVFAFVANPANIERWLGGPGEDGPTCEVTHLSGPLVGLDARYRLTRWSASGAKEDHELTTIEYEPDRRVALRFPGRHETVYMVEPAAAGTRLTEVRRPVENPRGLRARLVARSGFVPARVIPNIEWGLARIEAAMVR